MQGRTATLTTTVAPDAARAQLERYVQPRSEHLGAGHRHGVRGLESIVLALLSLAACPAAFAPHDTESEVRRTIEGLATRGIQAEVGEEALTFDTLTLSEIIVQPGSPSRVLFHVAGIGRLGAAAVGYYGSEGIEVRDGHSLAPGGAWLPKLVEVLSTLREREDALRRRNAAEIVGLAAANYRDGALTPKDFPALVASVPVPAPVSTFSVRVDGDRAEVTQVSADAGAPHGFTLIKVGESWRFSSGLL